MSENTLTYTVPGASCAHCVAAITDGIGQVAGVTSVEVDLETKKVVVAGQDLDDAAVRRAIDAAGYEVHQTERDR